jgi:Tfp pilus assembly protein PilW
MLSKRPHPIVLAASWQRLRLAGEEGSTLIELLVTLITGTVITLALVAVLIFSTRQETHLTDLAQATQTGRLAMTKVVDELHSACLAPSFTPIQAKSKANELRFINAYSKEAVVSKTEVNEHRIVWNEKAGTLTDETYPATKEETWPVFKYASTPGSSVLLASHISQSEAGGKKIPVFQYYGYSTESNESASSAVSQLSTTPLISGAEAELSSTAAATAAAVLISFNASSNASTTSLGKLGNDVSEPQQSQVTLSFSVPISETESLDAPCQ